MLLRAASNMPHCTATSMNIRRYIRTNTLSKPKLRMLENEMILKTSTTILKHLQ